MPSPHGPTYYAWRDARRRCHNPKDAGYSSYGGRGLSMCAEWRFSFANFLRDMGYRPEGMTLDRIDNNAGYSQKNCRWATSMEQTVNRRRTRFITHQGRTMCLGHWERELGLGKGTLWRRLARGIPVADALQPAQSKDQPT